MTEPPSVPAAQPLDPPAAPPAYPQKRECPYQPPRRLAELARTGALHRVRLSLGDEVWLVTSYEAGRQLLADPRLSANRMHPGFPLPAAQVRPKLTRQMPLVGADDPVHAAQRRVMNPGFSRREVLARQDEIQSIVDEVIDDLLAKGPPADLVPDFAVPIPSMVTSLILGIPYDDHEFFQDATSRMVHRAKTPEDTQQAGLELMTYLERQVDAQRTRPAGGMLGRLASEELPRGVYSKQEIVQMCLVILVGGHETTAQMLSLSVLTLLDRPRELARLREDPGKLPAAVEELLRYLSVTEVAGLRVATADIEVAGTVIRAGEGVIVSNGLANRDPAVHQDPDELDIERPNTHRHLSFGYGIHQCIGQSLARLELELALGSLLRRIPGLRVTVPTEQLPITKEGVVQGVESLPVAW